jgi:VIT1/CCC1 family predicted Fe2+/Mn2+ transporter
MIGHTHRNISGGSFRAAIFGASDGLITNISLILGVSGAHLTATDIRLTGLAGLIAGAFSMAAGEYVSMKAQSELLEAELELERHEIEVNPEGEHLELVELYHKRGLSWEVANIVADEMMKDKSLALEVHAREELGIDPKNLGSPLKAGLSSFIAFGLGALTPLIPWFFVFNYLAVVISIILTFVASGTVGYFLSNATGKSRIKGILRQIIVTTAAAGVTYLVGLAVGSTRSIT